MIIDANMDWLPPELLSNDDLMEKYLHIVPRAYDTFATLGRIPGTDIKQIVIEKPKGYVALNMGPESIDPKDRIAVMDEGKIDKAILRVPCFQEWLNLEMCKQVNDGMAAYAQKYKGRFHTVAIVPPWGEKASLHELERCVKESGVCRRRGVCALRNALSGLRGIPAFFQKNIRTQCAGLRPPDGLAGATRLHPEQ